MPTWRGDIRPFSHRSKALIEERKARSPKALAAFTSELIQAKVTLSRSVFEIEKPLFASISIAAHLAVVLVLTENHELPTFNQFTPTQEQREPLIARLIAAGDNSADSRNSSRTSVELHDLHLPAISLPMPQLPPIDAVASDSFEVAREVGSSDDFKAVEHLQGIYSNQIANRIIRVLDSNGAYHLPTDRPCVAYVIQNESGEVLDVDLNECQFSSEIQATLANAIRAASPLPSPPFGLAMGSYVKIDASLLQAGGQ
jgi:hypothetical protein